MSHKAGDNITSHQLTSIKECFTKVKQVFLSYLWDSLVTLELISLIPLVDTPFPDPLSLTWNNKFPGAIGALPYFIFP